MITTSTNTLDELKKFLKLLKMPDDIIKMIFDFHRKIEREKVEQVLKEIEKLRTKLKIVRKEGNYKQFVIADELLKELDWFENLIKKYFKEVKPNA